MFILYVLLIESAQSQSCVDADLSIRCMDRCYTVQQSCMESAFIETSKYDCYSGLTECVNACPCQKGCPNGCNQCNNSICECKNFSTSPDYQQCEAQYSQKYRDCISDCKENDFECISNCNSDFNNGLRRCPCQEECPNGCPCPLYPCESTDEEKSSVLILYKHDGLPSNRPLLTNVDGSYSYNIWFKFEDKTGVQTSCSLVYHNKMLVFGGVRDFIDQVSIVDKCSLKRFKSLPIPFFRGGCAVAHSDLVYLCFGTDQPSTGLNNKICHYANNTDLDFVRIQQKAITWHEDTRIAGSKGY